MAKKRESKLAKFKRDIILARTRGDSYMTIAKRYHCSREYIRQWLEKENAGNNVPKPFYLSVATQEEQRFFGCHATEEGAMDHFFEKVPINPDIWAYSVYRKGVRGDRRLWNNVIAREGRYVRLGTPVYGFANLEAQRRLVMNRPLPKAAEKLSGKLGDTELLRVSLMKCEVKEIGDSLFSVRVRKEPKQLSKKEEEEKIIQDLLK